MIIIISISIRSLARKASLPKGDFHAKEWQVLAVWKHNQEYIWAPQQSRKKSIQFGHRTHITFTCGSVAQDTVWLKLSAVRECWFKPNKGNFIQRQCPICQWMSYLRRNGTTVRKHGLVAAYRAFTAAMLEGWNNETVLHENRSYFPEEKMYCFCSPTWRQWRHMKCS